MNEVEQWVAVAGLDQKKSRSVREVLTLVGPELALLIVVLLWASTFIVMMKVMRLEKIEQGAAKLVLPGILLAPEDIRHIHNLAVEGHSMRNLAYG